MAYDFTSPRPPKIVEIAVDWGGNVTCDGEPTTREALLEAISARRKARADRPAGAEARDAQGS